MTDDVTLYLGDCLEVMKTLPDGAVDAVITDPPYGVNVVNNHAFADSEDVWLRLGAFVAQWADDRGLLCILFGASSTQARDLAHFHRTPDRTLVWSPAFSLSKSRANGMFYRWHPIYCWNLPKRHEGPSLDVLKTNCDGHNWWYHPGTKPVALMDSLVRIAAPNSAVLDPFMGSGSTAIACIQAGRRFIGIEIQEEYYQIAERRIADAKAQLRLALGEQI